MSVPPTTWSHSTSRPPPSTASSSNTPNIPSSTAPSLQPTTRGIDLGGWSVRVTSGPIGSSAEMDALSDLLGIPPPEMAFPHNSLVLQHSDSGFSLCLDAVRTLRSIEGVQPQNRLYGVDCRETPSTSKGSSGLGAKPKAKSSGGSIKVAYAKEWGKSRNEFVSSSTTSAEGGKEEGGSHFGSNTADITAAKDYDWTYSSTWAGALNSTSPQPMLPTQTTPSLAAGLKPLESPSDGKEEWYEPGSDPARDRIPVERLGPSSGEPILFYDDIVLYEDELADNGSSIVNVKVRVMPSGFLVLQRFFLRVDDVLFRVFDTRLYCAFPPPPVPKHISQPIPSTLPTNLNQLLLGTPRTAIKPKDNDVTMSTITNDTTSDEEEGYIPRLIRECSGSEASYSLVRSHLPLYKPHDLSPLTDINWVYNTLTKIERTRSTTYHANIARGQQLPRLGDKDATAGAKFLSPSTPAARFAAGRVDLSPAQAPVAVVGGDAGARIVGEVAEQGEAREEWAGCGGRVDVAVLRSHS
ncbi:hypothetical protein NDA11_001065 [Ustilago hordei]|uniref:Related to TIP41-negatively regulates the TOR signaling pathway n=1 Tax=Ustilago hordei TaxID=120017 RepID=I2G5S1_USTHO|nr:uncharacterized protein UHO2_01758 [Ustilago hordei]KAJ1039385.1 hypothetical protein NDA10_004373 [Ustilago hordei]KAJ1585994.1 hypothetical protein NDA12_003964 [Ustilago hordei]KAJ1589615.1 hypothetical protein NDA15_007138 [Ustilago hordei]KAJ1590600.1 hypothetical protein NDA11_001065 [Ustilago hordei]KAJ1600971.1 hypothetical protein NDA14_005513 [Ustilago hordei]